MDFEAFTDSELEEQVLLLAQALMGGCYRENAELLEELVNRFRRQRMACDALKAGLDEVEGELNMLDAEAAE